MTIINEKKEMLSKLELKGRFNADLKIYLYVCAHIKTIAWNFVFWIQKIFKLFVREVCKFLKK